MYVACVHRCPKRSEAGVGSRGAGIKGRASSLPEQPDSHVGATSQSPHTSWLLSAWPVTQKVELVWKCKAHRLAPELSPPAELWGLLGSNPPVFLAESWVCKGKLPKLDGVHEAHPCEGANMLDTASL